MKSLLAPMLVALLMFMVVEIVFVSFYQILTKLIYQLTYWLGYNWHPRGMGHLLVEDAFGFTGVETWRIVPNIQIFRELRLHQIRDFVILLESLNVPMANDAIQPVSCWGDAPIIVYRFERSGFRKSPSWYQFLWIKEINLDTLIT